MLWDFCQYLPAAAAAVAAVAAAAAVAAFVAAVALAVAVDAAYPAAACSGGSAAAGAASEAGRCLVSEEEVDQRLTAGLQHDRSEQHSQPETCGCPWTGCCL